MNAILPDRVTGWAVGVAVGLLTWAGVALALPAAALAGPQVDAPEAAETPYESLLSGFAPDVELDDLVPVAV